MATVLGRSASPGSLLADYPVRIPQTCLLTSDGYDDFIAHNGLQYRQGEDDETIGARFLAAELPDWVVEDLSSYLRAIEGPLSIRSSSLLEDAMFRPYAGLYATYMLPNIHPDFQVRLKHLLQAVKLVYASTWYAAPRAFSRSIGQEREDSMAVIIQRLVGRQCGDLFFPAISGVVQSWNYYPVAPMRPQDGYCPHCRRFWQDRSGRGAESAVLSYPSGQSAAVLHGGRYPGQWAAADVLSGLRQQRRFQTSPVQPGE